MIRVHWYWTGYVLLLLGTMLFLSGVSLYWDVPNYSAIAMVVGAGIVGYLLIWPPLKPVSGTGGTSD